MHLFQISAESKIGGLIVTVYTKHLPMVEDKNNMKGCQS